MDVKQTQSNIDIDNVLTVFPPENKDVFVNSRTTIFPILGGGRTTWYARFRSSSR